jgi:hypothetical protein
MRLGGRRRRFRRRWAVGKKKKTMMMMEDGGGVVYEVGGEGGTMCSSNMKAIAGSFDLRKRTHEVSLSFPSLSTAPCPVLPLRT